MNPKQPHAFVITLAGLFLAGTSLFSSAEDIQPLAATCTACHGPSGVSVNPAWPNLANQKAGYLITEMKAFRDGVRKDPLMSAAVKNLSDQQIEALAIHYSEQSLPEKNSTAINLDGKNVRAYCISCHGKHGITVNEEWPNLAGQQKDYLQKQLLAFRDGTRNGPIMQVIAKELNEAQIEAVAEYYSQLSATRLE